MEFIGRFHPVLVHLPIGILLLAFLFELFSKVKGQKKLRAAVRPALFWGALAAICAAITGLILAREGGHDVRLLEKHKIAGLVTTVISLLVYLFFSLKKYLPKAGRRKFGLLAFFPLIVLIILTGHLGGSLTHGSDFLFSSHETPQSSLPAIKFIPKDSGTVIYGAMVMPLLESRCYDCHSSKKQKGRLRLDRPEFIVKGGKNGPVLASGKPEVSEMVRRISLSIEDEDHMPPREKAQLSSGEIDLISGWIENGASFTMTIGETKDPEYFAKLIQSEASHPDSWWPEDDVEAPDDQPIRELQKLGVSVTFLGEDNHYLMVSCFQGTTLSPVFWQSLKKLADQIVWLRLSRMDFSGSELSNLKVLKNLRCLYLDFTSVSDEDLRAIRELDQLIYLNLSGTSITDTGIESLAGLKSLQKLFLFGTQVTARVTASLKKENLKLKIDTGGYSVPFLPGDTITYKRKPI